MSRPNLKCGTQTGYSPPYKEQRKCEAYDTDYDAGYAAARDCHYAASNETYSNNKLDYEKPCVVRAGFLP